MNLNRSEMPSRRQGPRSDFSLHSLQFISKYSPRYLNLPLRSEILEVLVPESYDLLLRSEKCKLVETFAGELRDLHALDYGADVRADLANFGAGTEEMGLLRICAQARIDEV